MLDCILNMKAKFSKLVAMNIRVCESMQTNM